MPFYKWIIQTKGAPEIQEEKKLEDPKISIPDANADANKRMVRVIRHISQLARIADDVFGGIDFECRKLFHRTYDLNARIQVCQEVVDNLNAKTVKVPVSTLTGNQEPRTPFRHSDAQDFPHIFNTYPRPPEVERLRRLANGPSPAAHIPCSETDGQAFESSSATHIYCQPLQIPERCRSRSYVNVERKEKTDKTMTSAVEVPSNIVPIDVSGQSFSRMSTFRKSLIYVDSLLGRKKKDKRRNTVTEGDSKDLKDALQNIINKDAQFSEESKKTSLKQCASNGINKTFLKDKNHKNYSVEETNNNSTIKVVGVDADLMISPKKFDSHSGHNKTPISHSSSLKPNSNNSDKTFSIKKPRSHIPISTNSAAMNVAVEMRQLNGIEEQSSSCSDHTSSDSDNRKNGEQDFDHRGINGEDSGFSDSYKAYKNRASDPCKISSTKRVQENDDIEPISSTSSENNTTQDDASSNDTTVESDAFYLSSDDSDEGSSDIFEQKYGSSTSLSTISDGSLNSLLSQTGTEMASSTGTLTSVGFESLPTPPPPPCIIVASNNETSTDATPEISPKNKSSSKCSPSKSSVKNFTSSKQIAKPYSPQKHAKALSNEKCKSKKSSNDISKGIFTSLVSKKSRSKEKSKPRDIELKMSAVQPKPFIDMYGNNSPQTISRIPVFVKDNSISLSEDEPKTQLQSFLPRDSRRKLEYEHESSSNSVYSQSYKQAMVETSPPSKECILTDVASPESVEIPLKYVQQVVVTPISRRPSNENSLRNSCRKALFNSDEPKQITEEDGEYKNISDIRNKYIQVSVRENNSGKPQRPNTLLTGSKPIARVVLDPEGRVKYSTNSLDRCLPYTYHSPSAIQKVNNQPRYSMSPPTRNDIGNSNYNPNYALHNCLQYSNQTYIPQELTSFNEHNLIGTDYNSCINQTNVSCKETCKVSGFHPTYPSPLNCQSFHPNNGMQTNKNVESCESYCPRPPDSYHTRKVLPTYEEALGQRYPSVIVSSPPDPNISGLPVRDAMLTEQNVNLHSQNMEQLSRLGHETFSSGYPTQSPSQMSPKGLLNNSLCKSQGSTMSTEDLFAVIHDCKKRLNIKTDSDISLASSSRSNSPSCLRPPQSRGSFVETGFLSPRNSAADASRDRRSWADFRPSSSTSNERKSLASDRLGRSKPTSMHDFKLLLLQARSSTQPSGPRKSAVEMLKIPSSPNGAAASPSGASSRYSNSFSAQSSPTSPSFIHSGHSTVPFKRHNSRVRSSLQSRYTMYPPIFEDCSEEAENVKSFE